MTRPVLVTIGASAAVLVALGVAKHFRASTSADTVAAPAQVSAARQVPGTAARESSSPVGWIAKPGPSTGGQKDGDRAAAWSDSHNEAPDTASSRTEGSATVLSSGSRPGSFIGTGRGVGSDGTGAVNIQTSVPAAALPSDLSNPAAGGSHPAGGQQGAQTGAAQSQAAVSGSDAAQSTNPDDQGPVLSISFDNPLPEKGDTAPIAEQDVTFDGKGATFSADSQYAIPDAGNLGTAESGTISFCLQPQWSMADVGATDASFVNLRTPNAFANRLQIEKNGQYLRFVMSDSAGIESGSSMVISSWQRGESHLVTATWGQALTSMYVDGQLVSSQTYQGEFQIPAGTPMYIGSDYAGGMAGAQSSLSNFQVYNRPLAQDEVGGLTAGCQ